MADRGTGTEFDWTPVIGKALAFLCLHYADMRDKRVGKQAEFLARLGVPRASAADLIGTSDESLRVLAGQRARRGGSVRRKASVKKPTMKKPSAKRATSKKAISKN